MLEIELPSEEAAEHGAEPPKGGGGQRLGDRREAVRVRIERMRKREQPDARKGGEEEPREPRPRLLAEHEPRADDGDQRLRLLQNDDGDEVAVEEGLREEDGRDRRRTGSDRDSCEHVGNAGAPERDERGNEQRQGARDEHDVLSEHDRRRRGRVRERLADEAVEPPHRGRDADEHDSRDVRDARRHRSKRRRSDTGCRARMRRDSPSATRTAAGFGTPLYVDAIASVYAPVAGTASRSPRRGRGSATASMRTSPDSQCFPAMRNTPSASSSARFASSAS